MQGVWLLPTCSPHVCPLWSAAPDPGGQLQGWGGSASQPGAARQSTAAFPGSAFPRLPQQMYQCLTAIVLFSDPSIKPVDSCPPSLRGVEGVPVAGTRSREDRSLHMLWSTESSSSGFFDAETKEMRWGEATTPAAAWGCSGTAPPLIFASASLASCAADSMAPCVMTTGSADCRAWSTWQISCVFRLVLK